MRVIAGFVLFVVLAAGCGGQGEYVPPLRPLGPGIPADLPELAPGQWAAMRLVVNG
ncbi:MAG: hypothetical protein AAB074_00010 [Planctomycetota bacterium]